MEYVVKVWANIQVDGVLVTVFVSHSLIFVLL